MAAGDLSPGQARYVASLVALTGLDRTAVVAWVGAESPWGVDKPSHNYLNIGPGRSYPSVEHAARAAADLVNNASQYDGIRRALPAGGHAQIEAIIASPWGTEAEPLRSVYAQLAGTGGRPPGADTVAAATPAGIFDDIPSPLPPFGPIGDLFGGALGAIVRGLTGPFLDRFGALLVGLAFTVTALGLVALGLARLTGRDPRQLVGPISAVT